jgi:hypothetical protein
MFLSGLEYRGHFTSQEQWQAWVKQQGGRLGPASSKKITSYALRWGVKGVVFGRIPALEMSLLGDEPREALLGRGLNSRIRGSLEVLSWHDLARDRWRARIYAHEALTPCALLLRGFYPRFLGSEYAPDEASARSIFPIPHVDIMNSSFADASFDFVLSHEVLEHVPDFGAALRDTVRILAPNGVFIATFPFDWNAQTTSIRASLTVDGRTEHLAPPEYHGNPVDPEGGSLVFQIPGWDVLDQCKKAGFARSEIIFLGSAMAGVVSRDIPGVFILRAFREG